MKYNIREAKKTDMNKVRELILELAVFEKEDNAVEVTVADLERDGFGSDPKFTCFVALDKELIIGMALVYPRYSTWKGVVIHLEDLIVSQEYRGKGIGDGLLTRVVQHGHSLGVKRICWEVLDWNEPAIKFYEQKGAHVLRDWNVVHLDEKGIQQFIA